jgi:hypothetical protein
VVSIREGERVSIRHKNAYSTSVRLRLNQRLALELGSVCTLEGYGGLKIGSTRAFVENIIARGLERSM